MKEILLTKGKVALVDDEDYERLSRYRWQALRHRKTWYACRTAHSEGERWTSLMHREILGITNRHEEVDHKDGNGLDNRRENLRVASLSQNRFNAGKYSTNKSGYKGVSFHTATGRWVASIRANNKQFFLGRFDDPVDAARAYDRKALELHQEFARLNFPKENYV